MKTKLLLPALLIASSGFLFMPERNDHKQASPIVGSVYPKNRSNVPNTNLSTDVDKNWLGTVQEKLTREEYHISYDPARNCYQSPNRKNNLRFLYHTNGFTVVPRTSSDNLQADWSVKLEIQNISRNKSVQYFEGEKLIVNENTASIEDDKLIVNYKNDENGMQQDFILKTRPEGTGFVKVHLKATTDLQLTAGADVAKFHNGIGTELLTYSKLKVWDSDNKILNGWMEKTGEGLALVVNDKDARYPITIDPLSSSAAWSDEGNQADASFGFSTSAAGDVNGDGFSDVIVAAHLYDNGQTDEGKAWVYHGSSSGLSATANWSCESNQATSRLGTSANTAGDVNGDGYSDIIVGAYWYDNGETDEGMVFVWHGSASGVNGGTNGTPSNPDWLAESNLANSEMGWSSCTAGDVNGDGYSDVLISSRFYDNGQSDEGIVLAWYGSSTGVNANVDGDPTNYDWLAESNDASAWFGEGIACAYDVNGDGYSDVIIGSRQYDDNTETDEGAAFVWHGSSTGINGGTNGTPSNCDWRCESNQNTAWLGLDVAGLGDVDGDGYADVIVGARQYDNSQTDEGAVFVWYGSSTGVNANVDGDPTNTDWRAESNLATSWFSHRLGGAGDVNGDGFADVIVGARLYENNVNTPDEGMAFVWHGSQSGINGGTNGDPTNAIWTAESNQSGAEMGLGIGTAGDVNGDGFSDVIIGAQFYTNGSSNEGKAWVYHGSAAGLQRTAGWTAQSNQQDAAFGFSVSWAGDVNGDGYADILIGAHLYDNGNTDEGKVFAYYGSASGPSSSSDWTAEVNQTECRLGTHVSSAGDVNGDGYSDVMIGAYWYDNGNTDEGKVWVWHGSSTGINGGTNGTESNANWTAESNQTSAEFGWIFSTAGDVNGDGYSDVIISARFYDNGQTDEGMAFVWHGSSSGVNGDVDGTPSNFNWKAESDQADAWLGEGVDCAGDVNGDGYSDVIIGARQYDNGNTDEGIALVWHGSSSGVNGGTNGTPSNPNWKAEVDQTTAWFGLDATTAGDVNGDGYSDIMVGARYYDNGNTDEGKVWVWHGSSSGVNADVDGTSSNANWTAESNQTDAWFSHRCGTAGDVNGDGYSDIIIGCRFYDNGQTDEGMAFVWHGSSSGVNGDVDGTTANASWSVESDQANAEMGQGISTAGDVNGDGYSDVIVAARLYDDGSTDEGKVFVYYGNEGDGMDLKPGQFRTNLTTRVVFPLYTSSSSSVGLAVLGRTFYGRGDVKFLSEVKALGTAFNNSSTNVTSSWTDIGTSGSNVTYTNTSLSSSTYYKWRGRVQYRLSEGNPQVYSRWLYFAHNGGLGESDFRTGTPARYASPYSYPFGPIYNTSLSIYPNPAGSSTNILYSLKEKGPVCIEVYSADGKLVSKIADNEYKEAGSYTITFVTEKLPPGVYYLKLATVKENKITKMIIAH